MLDNVLMSESFSSGGKRHYFLDFKRTSRDGRFIQISRTDEQLDGSYRRSFVVVFEEDFHFLISAMSSLFHHAAYLQEDNMTVREIREACIEKRNGGIPCWANEVKPREKLEALGAQVLEDQELLAILLGSGSPGEDVVALSGRLLKAVGGFCGFDRLSISSLKGFKGIGFAKATALKALVEIARRMNG